MEHTLLTIEDEIGVQDSIRFYFEDQGYQVLTAEDGLSGLELFRKQKPDIVLVDLRMPGVSGLDVIATLKQESPATPIVVVSGTGVLTDAISAIRMGAWDYVTKPIDDMAVLEHVVNKALERARLIQQNQEHQHLLEREVWRRTEELRSANSKLMDEIYERVQAERKVVDYQNQLRALVSQLTISEEKERRNLADRVHDSLGQTMAIMKLNVDRLLASGSVPGMTDFLQTMQEMLIDALGQAQQITKDLGCPLLQQLGFKSAVEEWFLTEIEQKYGLQTQVRDEGFPSLNEETATMLFRAIRELAMNVVKHAQAQTIHVTLSRVDGQVLVRLQDDGQGFDSSQLEPGIHHGAGYGLFSIRERIHYVNGSFEIYSHNGVGTVVEICVPLEAAEVSVP